MCGRFGLVFLPLCESHVSVISGVTSDSLQDIFSWKTGVHLGKMKRTYDMAMWNRRQGRPVTRTQDYSSSASTSKETGPTTQQLPRPGSEDEYFEDDFTRRTKERFLARLNLRPLYPAPPIKFEPVPGHLKDPKNMKTKQETKGFETEQDPTDFNFKQEPME